MPSSSAYSLAAGYPASAITLYAVLAGHGADGGLWGISWGCAMWFIYWGRQEWWQVRPLL